MFTWCQLPATGFLSLVLALPTAAARAAEAPDFESQIAPLLVSRCLDCHQSSRRSGELNLDTKAGLLAGGDQGPALVPGQPQASLLWQRVASGEMPPPEAKEHHPLTKAEQQNILAWIAAGAPWPPDRQLGIHEKPVDLDQARAFWSFQAVQRPAVPVVPSAQRAANPVDLFLSQRLTAQGLKISPRAERLVLLRRVLLDVRGTPPTLAEQDEFASDPAPDAYERLLDRLLAAPTYGERWARHWLDLVRYADTNGYERDGAKPSVWRYRDYVISALNRNLPYDQFVVEQLAGDELPEVTPQTLIATGFHALGTWQDEVDPLEAAQYRADELDDMIRTTSQTFLGLTLGCARCHNHKFDPLTMGDYYSLSAILAPLKRPNKGRTDRALPLGTPEEIAAEEQRDAALAALQQQLTALQKSKPADQTDKAEQMARLRQQMNDLREQTPTLPAAYRCTEEGPPPPTHLLLAGRASNPGPLMQPRVPDILAPTQPTFPASGPRTSLRRLTFARWLTSPENPLTSRVMVNRIWQHHFGTGIVATPSDFGNGGARPTHPELLDWLAHWFAHDAQWSLKQLHRLLLSTEAYCQTSLASDSGLAADPENKLLWRYPYRRLDVEAIRDSLLAVAGNLEQQMYGPAVQLPIPAAAIEAHTDKQAAWKAASEPAINRRTIYAYVKRTLLIPMLETLDFCDTTQSTEKRAITSVAPQALTLFNGELLNHQAQVLAQRLEREAGGDLDQQLTLAYRLALVRLPTPAERTAMRAFLERESQATSDDAARVQLCRVILNLNEFVYPN